MRLKIGPLLPAMDGSWTTFPTELMNAAMVLFQSSSQTGVSRTRKCSTGDGQGLEASNSVGGGELADSPLGLLKHGHTGLRIDMW